MLKLLNEIDELMESFTDKYAGSKLLDKNISSIESIQNIHLVLYQINTSGVYPFLQFFFRKTNNNDDDDYVLNFLSFEQRNSNGFQKSIEVIEEIGRCFSLPTTESVKFKGVFNNFLFFQFPDNTIDAHLLFTSNDLWLITVDEIFNRMALNTAIHTDVFNFFHENMSFSLLLADDNHEGFYETPTVVYAGCCKKECKFLTTFGILPDSIDEWPYKFYSFEDAKNNSTGGLIRLAIFLGVMKFKNDEGDSDSIFDKDNLLLQIKDISQQVPLTFHYFNSNKTIII